MNTAKRTMALVLVVCMVFALTVSVSADDHTHSYTETVLKAPTCTANGIAKYACECGEKYYKSIPAAHAEPGADAVTVEPTCAKDGSVTYTCSECGESLVRVLPATGKHNYEETVTEATCTAPAKAGSICTVCGQEDPENPAEIVKDSTPLGHDFVETVTKEATCSEAGEKAITCSRCDYEKTEAISAAGHTWDDGEYRDASCALSNGMLYTCTVCGETKFEPIEGELQEKALGHKLGEAVYAEDNTHVSVCSVCGESVSEACTFESKLTPASHTEHAYTTYTCSVCGYSYKVVDEESELDANHTYEQVILKAPTCTTAGIAKLVCPVDNATNGYKSIPAAHTWNEGTVGKEATCTEAGEKTLTCTVCGETSVVEIPALGHDLKNVIDAEANCGVDGKQHKECTRCDYVEEATAIPATGEHKYEESAIDATCTEPAKAGEVCSVCGDVKNAEVVAGSEALGHDYVEEITTAATCTEAGEKTFTCSRCNDSYTEVIPAKGHTYDEGQYRSATCTSGDAVYYTCIDCGEVSVDEIGGEIGQAALGHKWGEFVSDGEGKHVRTCSVCGEVESAECAYESVVTPSTHTEHAYTTYTCSVCGYSYKEVDEESALDPNHTYEQVILKAPTCTTAGIAKLVCPADNATNGYKSVPASHSWDEGTVDVEPACLEKGSKILTCTVCGETSVVEIDALGHDIQNVIDVEANCGVDGKEHKECTRCDYIEEAVVIPATGEHEYEEKAIDATCTEPAKVGKVCSICGDVKDAEIVDGSEALGHDYVEEITTAAACEEPGVKTCKCSRCGDSYTEEIPAAGHSYDEGVYQEADCTHGDGVKYTCSVCGKTYVDEIGGEIGQAALGHKWGEFVSDGEGNHVRTCSVCNEPETAECTFESVVTPSTHTEHAYTTYTCSVCGYSYAVTDEESALDPNHTYEEVILKAPTCTTAGIAKLVCPADGAKNGYKSVPAAHTWDEGVVTKEAICTEAGEKTLTCTVCGETSVVAIEALGHDLQDVIDADATCGKDGKQHKECTRCNYTEEATSIPATGEHEFAEQLIDATCTEPAKVGMVCSVCGTVQSAEIVVDSKPLGHDYVATLTKDPTCTESGEASYVCSRCEDSYTEEVPAVGHSWGESTYRDATCTAPNGEVIVCKACGEESFTAITGEGAEAALGHDFSVVVETVEPTCSEDGYTVYKCSRCEETEKADIVKTTGAHTAKVVRVLKAATCSATGIGKAECVYCGESMGYVAIPKAEHTYDDTKAYETEDGYLKVICDVCGEEVTLQDLNPCRDGHTWDEGKVTTEATCEKDGVTTFTCSECGTTRTEAIKATGHNWMTVDGSEKAATCTEKGTKTVICTKCENTEVQETAEALGHSYVDGVCERCGAKEPAAVTETEG